MPLRKLWNALRGTPSLADSTTLDAESPSHGQVDAKSQRVKPATDGIVAAKSSLTSHPAKASRGLLGFGRGPHEALCRLIKKNNDPVHSVLEIGVGDGTRAVAVIETLAQRNPQHAIRYLAIDQFELAGNPITLMQFHRDLRQSGIRPQIFPADVRSGLVRIGYTFGAVDLVLISQDTSMNRKDSTHRETGEGMSEEAWGRLLSRVTHRDSIVMKQDDEGWRPLDRISQWSSGLRRSA